MKSKSTNFIMIIVVVLVVGTLLYFFVVRNKSADTAGTGLVSQTTGAGQGLQNSTVTGASSATGSQVVQILRNLSAIKLDDNLFRNPAFTMLVDISVNLPPATNQGRRNPFALVGTDAAAATVPAGAPVTGTPAQ